MATNLELRSNVLREDARKRRSTVDVIFRRWDEGEAPSARAAIDDHPSLWADRSIVLELAYDEYRRNREAGVRLDKTEFCKRFPEVGSSLVEVLEFDSFLSVNSHLLEEQLDVSWPHVGETILGFEILDELGRGAFSRVYLAQQSELGDRLVALKISTNDVQEANILGRFNHSNIVPIYSVHRDPETTTTLLCMPYQGRSTLSAVIDELVRSNSSSFDETVFHRVANGVIDGNIAVPNKRSIAGLLDSYVEAVLRIGSEIADGLQYAHARKILHLDLKPSNILLDFDGRPLILDFNLAADVGSEKRRVGGTLPYMSPEALRAIREPENTAMRPGPQADVFALGVILYELLTSRRPFAVPTRDTPLCIAIEDRLAQLCAPIVPIRQANSLVDVQTACTIERCLQFDPRLRPSSAQELAACLRECRKPLPRVRRWILRHRATTAAVLLLFFAACIAALIWFLQRDPNYLRQYHAGEEALANGRYAEAVDYFREVLHDRPADSDSLIGSGIALTKLSRYDDAIAAFSSANQLRPTSRSVGGLIYLFTRTARFKDAITLSKTFNVGRESEPSMLNNLAVAFVSEQDWDQAEKLLDPLCRLESSPPVVLFNRAKIDVLRVVQNSSYAPSIGKSHIDQAIERGLTQGQAFLFAAVLTAKSPADEPARTDAVLRYVRLAVENGAPLSAVGSFSALSAFLNQAAVGGRLAEIRPREDAVYLVDPLLSPF